MKNSLSQASKITEALETEILGLQEQKKHLVAENGTLKDQQKSARQSVKAEVEAYRQRLLEQVANELEPLELSKTNLLTEIATLTTDKEQLEKDVTRKREDLLTLEEALDKKAGDLSAVEESIAEKKTEKQRLAETVEGLERQIVAHTGSVSELETKINEKETRFAELQRDVLKVQGDLDDLEKDRETRKRALDDELRTVLIQTQDALTRLKELQETEDATRKSIANERLILDKERQSLLTLKAKLSGAEARYAKLNQMTKL